MSSLFIESRAQIQDVRADAEQLEITPDFTSFLGDIALGMNSQEFSARLRADAQGRARTSDGGFFYIRGNGVVERRRVTDEQKKVLRADERFRRSVEIGSQQAEGFNSFAEDILNGSINDPQELDARLRADAQGRARTSDGDFFYIRGNGVVERRRVREVQANGVRDLLAFTQGANRKGRQLSDLASFYAQVNDNADPITPQELDARLRADAQGRARTSDGDFFYIRGNGVVERRRVTDEDAGLLRSDLADTQETVRASLNARDCQSFFRDVLEGAISSPQELDARLRADAQGRARTSDGDFFYIRGNGVVERRRVNPDQAQSLVAILPALQACGEYRDAVIASLLNGGDGSDVLRGMDAAYLGSMTDADARAVDASRQAATEVCRAWRRCVSEANITQAIIDTNGDTDQVFRMIRDDPEEDTADRQRAERLTALCYQRRRVDFSANVTATLANPDVDFDDLLAKVGEFAGSPDPRDRERALELTRRIYAAEIVRDQARLAVAIASNPRDPAQYEALQGSIKLRPSVDGFNYNDIVQARTKRLEVLLQASRESGADAEIGFAVANFDTATPAAILNVVNDLADRLDSDEPAQALLEYYKLYLTNRRTLRRNDYEQVFSAEVEAVRKVLRGDYDFNEGLETNLPAAKKLAERFSSVILPLFQSLRGEPGFQDVVESFISGGSPGDREPRNRFILDVDRLAAQRDLSENETTYLKSVQALSAFNPYIVAIANANPGLAFAYLESYFTELSSSTNEKWFGSGQDTPYIPLLQVGTGPNGMASLGEIMRKRPDLIGNMLVIDENDFPSGPFGIPKGEAWDLNSANSSGFDAVTLPDAAPAELEGKRIRDFGSPTRWFPGERNADQSTRPGSINTSVDYLVTPDVISDGRYPNNEDLSLILQLQTAMLADNLMLKTKLLGVEEMPAGSAGLYRAWLQIEDANGSKRVTSVYTDGVITSSGLGEKSYGFNLEGSRAEDVLATQPDTGFPKYSTTLEAFKALASKETRSPIPGETIVIYGNGNSTDTLVEYLGGLFESKNPVVRNIRKIYVVGDGTFSRRPRYAQISDLRARNGRESLVEVVEARVGDVDYTDPSDVQASKLRLFDSNGNTINDANGNEVRGDHIIAATGFRPQLSRIFEPLGVVQQTPAGQRLDTTPVVLPTNPNVAVAETVDGKKELLLVGTASSPASFKVVDKLAQLPDLAREALLRNGAGNAVAIGFRAPDTQAAVRLYLENNSQLGAKNASGSSDQKRHVRISVDPNRQTPSGSSIPLDAVVPDGDLPPLRKDIASGSETLSPLLLRSLAPVKLIGAGQNATYQLRLDLNGQATLTTNTDVPTDILDLLVTGVANPYFQTYARNALRLRRGSSAVDINIHFKNGRLSYKDSYVQAA